MILENKKQIKILQEELREIEAELKQLKTLIELAIKAPREIEQKLIIINTIKDVRNILVIRTYNIKLEISNKQLG